MLSEKQVIFSLSLVALATVDSEFNDSPVPDLTIDNFFLNDFLLTTAYVLVESKKFRKNDRGSSNELQQALFFH